MPVVAAIRYSFGEFELDPQARQLQRAGAAVPIPERHFDVLHLLVSKAPAVLTKDALVAAAWGDVAVTDNSLEQAVSALRRSLGPPPDGRPFIETVPRRGYRFARAVVRSVARATDASLDALLAPHRAWIEGRGALETLEREHIARARAVFERLVEQAPEQPLAHVGLANAYAMQYETTRADERPDADVLERAAAHAREGCRLDPQYGEAWATLGFVLDRGGHADDAAAALRRAVSLEPDNWRHHVRLAYASWGEERLSAARRSLTLLPGLPLAHWLAATVHVARAVLHEAERELTAGIATRERQGERVRFSAVGLHWLRGLVRLARDEHGEALADFERELSYEGAGHLYGRECCANAWYAIGVLHARQERLADARHAFSHAIARVAVHPLAHLALAALSESSGEAPSVRAPSAGRLPILDAAIYRAAELTTRGDHSGAAATVAAALTQAPTGPAGWIVPVEPLLNVAARPDLWLAALELLRARAA